MKKRWNRLELSFMINLKRMKCWMSIMIIHWMKLRKCLGFMLRIDIWLILSRLWIVLVFMEDIDSIWSSWRNKWRDRDWNKNSWIRGWKRKKWKWKWRRARVGKVEFLNRDHWVERQGRRKEWFWESSLVRGLRVAWIRQVRGVLDWRAALVSQEQGLDRNREFRMRVIVDFRKSWRRSNWWQRRAIIWVGSRKLWICLWWRGRIGWGWWKWWRTKIRLVLSWGRVELQAWVLWKTAWTRVLWWIRSLRWWRQGVMCEDSEIINKLVKLWNQCSLIL